MNRVALVLAALTLVPAPALAEPTTWNLDPMHSHATFTVRHLGISNVRGEFGKIDGKLMLDDADAAKSQVEVTIDVNSIDTQVEKRDAHLRSPDFFDAQNHPKMTFKSTSVEKAGDGYKVTGDLTIRGNTKPITLQVDEFSNAIKDPQGANRRAVHATGKLNRKEYGLTWNKAIETGPVVGDEIKLDIAAEFVQAPAAPGAQARAEDAAASKGKGDGAAKAMEKTAEKKQAKK